MHTFPMSDHERILNINYNLGSGRTPGSQYLIVNGVKYGYNFRELMLTNMLILLVLLG